MENEYELVFCIINSGFSEIVMDAATKAGARGGTVIRARGTANPDAEQFFNLTVSPDKEIIMMIVFKNTKDAILKAVYHAAGLEKESQGIAFSLPVDMAAGLAGS